MTFLLQGHGQNPAIVKFELKIVRHFNTRLHKIKAKQYKLTILYVSDDLSILKRKLEVGWTSCPKYIEFVLICFYYFYFLEHCQVFNELTTKANGSWD